MNSANLENSRSVFTLSSAYYIPTFHISVLGLCHPPSDNYCDPCEVNGLAFPFLENSLRLEKKNIGHLTPSHEICVQIRFMSFSVLRANFRKRVESAAQDALAVFTRTRGGAASEMKTCVDLG